MVTNEQRVYKAVSEQVEIVAYDPAWPRRFEEERRHLLACLAPHITGRIEHFGSTAVPGLAAKPVVDILVEVPSLRAVNATIAPLLAAQGYEYFARPSWADPNVPSYAWFIKRDARGRRTHHIHMLEAGAPEWERLLFRDYLIAHPEVAREYSDLKYRSAAAHGNDRLAYAKAKTAFITRITRIARREYGKPS